MTKDTVNIHGKEYETVASRVQRFRSDDEDGMGIVTEIVEIDEIRVVMKASIVDQNDRVIGTGHAEEIRTSSTINKSSALENCETSAIGRALASIGYAGTEYASADEVAQAVSQQSYTPKTASEKQVKFAESLLEKTDQNEARAWFKANFGNKKLSALTSKECSEFIEYLKGDAPDRAEADMGETYGGVDDLSEYDDGTF